MVATTPPIARGGDRSPELGGMEPVRQTLVTSDGVRLAANWYPGREAPVKSLIAMPALAAPQRYLKHPARWLQERGWGVLTFDYRGIGGSEPRARHSRNLRARPSAAVAVYDSTQTWGRPDRGIQLFGSARPTRDDTAYAARFPEYESFEAYRAYELVPNRVKLFDERSFGAATFVTGHPGRDGRLAWERTEVYNSRR